MASNTSSVDLLALGSFVQAIAQPWIPVNQAHQGLAAAGLDVRIMHVAEMHSERAALELRAKDRYALVPFASRAAAHVYEHGWTDESLSSPVEPVVPGENLLDALAYVLWIEALGGRTWCSSEWSVRARMRSLLEELPTSSET